MSGVVSVNLFHLLWVIPTLAFFATMCIICAWLTVEQWKVASKFDSILSGFFWALSTTLLYLSFKDFWPLAFPVT